MLRLSTLGVLIMCVAGVSVSFAIDSVIALLCMACLVCRLTAGLVSGSVVQCRRFLWTARCRLQV